MEWNCKRLARMSTWKIMERQFIRRHRHNQLAVDKRIVCDNRFTHTNNPLIKRMSFTHKHTRSVTLVHLIDLYFSIFFSGSLTQNQIQSQPMQNTQPQQDHTHVKASFQQTSPMPQNIQTQQSAMNTQFNQLFGNTSSMQSNNSRTNA